MTDTTQKTSRKAPEAVAGAEEEKSGWYRLHFLRNQAGPGKVITRVGAGMARFKASQTDPEAEDFPTKVVKLTPEQAADFARNPAFDIRPSKAPAPKGLGTKLVQRTIGSTNTTPAEGETKVEEGGS